MFIRERAAAGDLVPLKILEYENPGYGVSPEEFVSKIFEQRKGGLDIKKK